MYLARHVHNMARVMILAGGGSGNNKYLAGVLLTIPFTARTSMCTVVLQDVLKLKRFSKGLKSTV